MKSLADRIEEYLRYLIERSESKTLQMQRTELAETFGCVPSQITYVLSTRFTIEEGFVTESRRGGKGYIRIRQIDSSPGRISRGYNQREALAAIENLWKEGFLDGGEVELLKCLLNRHVLGLAEHERHLLRGRMLRAVYDLLGDNKG